MTIPDEAPDSRPGPPPLPPPPLPERTSGTWDALEDVYPRRKSWTGVGRAAPGHFTIHPQDWDSPIFRSAVVPEEDNPLRGWRRVGADLLHPDLWPALARINPVLAYLSARRRSAFAEDWMGCAPWLLVGAYHVWLFLLSPVGRGGFGSSLALELALLPVLFAACTGHFVGVHIRRSLAMLPFEELMVTPLKPENVVQGMTIRPMAVQAAAGLVFTLLHVPLAVLGEIRVSGSPTMAGFFYATLYLPVLAVFLKVAIELGGALGARAHFCIKDAGTASWRVMLDLGRELFVRICLPVGALGVTLHFAAITGIGAFLFILFFALLVGLVVVFPGMLYRTLREDALVAMQWTCEHPEEWWSNEQNEHDRLVQRRGLATPWRHLVDVTPPEYRSGPR